MLSLSDLWNLPITLPYELLQNENNIFSPFELNEDFDNPLSEVDPDLQYYNSQCNTVLNSCDYYLEDGFNDQIKKLNIDNNAFSLIHLNIWSASEKITRFESYLSNLSHTFDIVGLTENWLKPHNESLCNLYGYKSEHRYRPLRSGGGVSLLFKKHIEYFIREDLSVQCNYAESLFVEIDKGIIGKEQNIVGVIYRPPDANVKDFNEYVNSFVQSEGGKENYSYPR